MSQNVNKQSGPRRRNQQSVDSSSANGHNLKNSTKTPSSKSRNRRQSARDEMDERGEVGISSSAHHRHHFESEATELYSAYNYDDGDDDGGKGRKGGARRASVSSLRGDYGNVALLLFLYILQGIPLGLAGAVPMILSNRKVSYSDQAIFSFVNWPFSVKLLWAPLVDSLYSTRFGRRKSWLVPVQYAIAAFMYVLSSQVTYLLGDGTAASEPVNVYFLTAVFFMLNFLAATQDIAVDGWALTMLSRRNVAYASTCNTVGQTAGYFLGNVLFLALESPDFSNKYVRPMMGWSQSPLGLITFSGFLYFWSLVFVITTTLVMLLKSEREPEREESGPRSGSKKSKNKTEEMSLLATYKMLIRILCLPSVRLFALILLTCKIGFAPADSVTGLKLIDHGVHKENLALLAVPMVPLQICLPWLISRFTSGPRPLDVFLKAYPYRLLFGLVFSAIVWWTGMIKPTNPDDGFPIYYYLAILVVYAIHQVTLYCMFVSLMSFHAKISDPLIGGTYMTLLNTVTNLGGNWPSTVSLWFVDSLTWKSCTLNGTVSTVRSCDSKQEASECKLAGGECTTDFDGYYVEMLIGLLLGFAWLWWGRKRVLRLQSLSPSAWKCT